MRNPYSTSAIDGAAAILCHRLCRTLAPRSGVSIDRLRALVRPELTQSVGEGHIWSANVRDGKAPLIVLSGWACEQRILECGRRQIFSFLLAGDLLSGTKAEIVSLTPMVVLDASEIMLASSTDACLARLLQDMLRQQMDYIYEHVVRLGTQNAADRAYDLLNELFCRLRQWDSVCGTSVAFPVTQEMLADTLGMSPVHVNRVLQQMRRDGMLTLGRGRLTIHAHNFPVRKSA